jgi:hypothetical protein
MKKKILLISISLISFFSNWAQNIEIHQSKKNLYPVFINNKYGYINDAGKIIIEPQFDKAENFSDGLAEIQIGGKYGFIDSTGRIIIIPQFDNYVGKFSEGLAIVNISGKYGYINKAGKIIIPPQFYGANNFSEGLALVANDEIYKNSWGYIDKSGKFVIEPIYGGGDYFKDGLAPVHFNGKLYGFVNRKGDMVIQPQFACALPFKEGLAWVSYSKSGGIGILAIDAVWGAINLKGKFIINPKDFFMPFPFSEGMSYVGIKDANGNLKYGYINKKGIMVIPPQFEMSFTNGSFEQGLACVKIANKYGFINKKGSFVINPLFDQAGNFERDLVPVWSGKKFGYIDKTGKWIWEKSEE